MKGSLVKRVRFESEANSERRMEIDYSSPKTVDFFEPQTYRGYTRTKKLKMSGIKKRDF